MKLVTLETAKSRFLQKEVRTPYNLFLYYFVYFLKTKIFLIHFGDICKRNIFQNVSFLIAVRIEYKISRMWQQWKLEIIYKRKKYIFISNLKKMYFNIFSQYIFFSIMF